MPLRRNRNLGAGWGQWTRVRQKGFSEMGISQKNQTRQKRFTGLYETVAANAQPNPLLLTCSLIFSFKSLHCFRSQVLP